MIININISDKHATAIGAPHIVCGNSTYTIEFTFDKEWAGLSAKTARFVYVQDGAVKYTDVVFSGNTVAVPVLANTREVLVGVYADDIQTTTPARIPCELSIRCGTAAPVEPTPSQWDQIIELLNTNAIVGPAGEPGASAYELALKNGYKGTEAEWLESLKGGDYYYSVEEYGAKGDGVTDDGPAIQAAMDACQSAGGGVVYFPAGVYILNACVYYYSNMRLNFAPGAILRRGSASLRYLLANDIKNTDTSYNGTHDVQIIGATFDGNAEFRTTSHNDNKCTLLNTGHARDILVENCTFKNGNVWHLYEVCASENVKIINCIFDGRHYGGMSTQQDGYAELLQFDNDCNSGSSPSYGATKNGTVGDLTPCENIQVKGCKFYCNGHTTAIGNHNPQEYNHEHIRVSDCIFTGGAGSRGYICFDASTIRVDIYNNTFDDNAVMLCCLTDTYSTIHDNRIDAAAAFSVFGGVTFYCNLVNGVLDASSAEDAIESISFDTFATLRTGDSTYGYATLQSSDIKKYRGRIMGEIKFSGVTTNDGNGVLPMEVKEGYRPKVTAGLTSEAKKLVGAGYISASNGNTRITFHTGVSNGEISVRFDYAV